MPILALVSAQPLESNIDIVSMKIDGLLQQSLVPAIG